MTVLIYIDTGKQVGDPDHLKVFANEDAAETWFQENEPTSGAQADLNSIGLEIAIFAHAIIPRLVSPLRSCM